MHAQINFQKISLLKKFTQYFLGIALIINTCNIPLYAGPKYKITKSGLKYQISQKVKKGLSPIPLHTVQILFSAKLADGTIIASSIDRNKPMEFIYQNNLQHVRIKFNCAVRIIRRSCCLFVASTRCFNTL